jgi:hypothetical protein
MCLFRPHKGDAGKNEVYLIRRTDGKAFGATGKDWTVGLLQPLITGGIRVRYRPESHFMECASELVQPAEVVQFLALFVKSVS